MRIMIVLMLVMAGANAFARLIAIEQSTKLFRKTDLKSTQFEVLADQLLWSTQTAKFNWRVSYIAEQLQATPSKNQK
jgi:hypothetical protein